MAASNTVEQGRIYFSEFSKVFKLDAHFFDVLTWDISQLLMFVIPILFFLLAIKFSKKWIRFVQEGLKSVFRWVRQSYRGVSTNFDDRMFQKSKASKVEGYKESNKSYDHYGEEARWARWRVRNFFRKRNDRYYNKYNF